MHSLQKPVCYIVGGSGELPRSFPFSPRTEDFVIAADGGYEVLCKYGIRTDLLIGDFDSLSPVAFKELPQTVVRLPKEKDKTDMLAALEYGLQKGYTEFYIYGGTGGCMRHTYANIQLLNMLAEQNAHGYLFGRDEVMTVIKDTEFRFSNAQNGYLSVFALSKEAKGVTLKNLKYPLENCTMSDIFPLGVSNEFQKDKLATVSVAEGTLLLIYDANIAEI